MVLGAIVVMIIEFLMGFGIGALVYRPKKFGGFFIIDRSDRDSPTLYLEFQNEDDLRLLRSGDSVTIGVIERKIKPQK